MYIPSDSSGLEFAGRYPFEVHIHLVTFMV